MRTIYRRVYKRPRLLEKSHKCPLNDEGTSSWLKIFRLLESLVHPDPLLASACQSRPVRQKAADPGTRAESQAAGASDRGWPRPRMLLPERAADGTRRTILHKPELRNGGWGRRMRTGGAGPPGISGPAQCRRVVPRVGRRRLLRSAS